MDLISTSENNVDLSGLLIRPAQKDDYGKIREFLLESSNLYPDIESWWRNRVRAGFEQNRRIVLVVDSGRSIDGLFIGKPGDSAKICTLRLREYVRNQGVGRVLVTEGLSRLLARSPSRFHVTISEGAEEGCASFFESIGFYRVAVEPNRYKNGVDEFIYSSSTGNVAQVINNKLTEGIERTLFGVVPKQMPNEHTILMSLRPEFADLVLHGRKTIEFRRRFSKKHEGATIVFYVSSPIKRFMFAATITRVDHRKKQHLWNSYQEEGGISRNKFEEYFIGLEYGYAIHLADIRHIPNQLGLDQAREIFPKLRPPQSFQTLQAKSPLARALQLPVHV